MVGVQVGGHLTRLILDTGSTDHILTVELNRRIGLESLPSDHGTDHAGASVPSRTLAEVPVILGGQEFSLENVVEISGPALFEDRGIGGLLSPQRLHPTAHVVIDLVDDELILVDGEADAAKKWLLTRSPALHPIELERADDLSTVLVHAAIEPFLPVVTMLNTGGSGTEFALAAFPALPHGELAAHGKGLSGTEVMGWEVGDKILRVGEARFPLGSLLVREEMPFPYGLIGMDVLRKTVLMVSPRTDGRVLWMVPPSAIG